MKHLIFILAFALSLSAQTTINGSRTILGRWDASGATSTAPVKVGLLSGLPGTCTAGDFYFATDGQIGRKLQSCTVTNTWVPIGYQQGTSAPGTCAVGDLFFDTDATAGQNLFGCTATNAWTALGGGSGGAGTILTVPYPSSGMTVSTTYYGSPGQSWISSAERIWYSTVTGSLKDLYCALSAAITTGNTVVLTVRKNASDTSTTCTITDGSSPTSLQSCNSAVTTSVTKGDKISIKAFSSVASVLPSCSFTIQ